MQAKTAIAKILKLEGVDHLACFPNNAIIEAGAVEGIRPICARTERVAVNIAGPVLHRGDADAAALRRRTPTRAPCCSCRAAWSGGGRGSRRISRLFTTTAP